MSDQPTNSPIDTDSDAFLGLALKRLRGEGAEDASVILLAERDPSVRAAVSRMLSALCEGFEIQGVADSIEAVSVLREGLSKKVALILAEVDERQGIEYLVAHARDASNDGRIPGMDNVPLIAVFGDTETNGSSGEALAERYLRQELIDSSIRKPFDTAALKRAIAIAIARREGTLHDLENKLKPQVLREFVEYYQDMLKVWQTDIQNISFFPTERAAVLADTREADIVQIFEFIGQFESLLTTMKNLGENISVDDLRKLVHDMNNKLTIPRSYINFILESNPNDQDRSILTKIQDDTYQLERYLRQIGDAYNGRGTWSQIHQSRPELQLRNKLEFPKGTKFLVVDDDEAIIKVAGRTIEQAGGKALTARNRAELCRALEEVGPDGMQVVLLDNNLGKDESGVDCFGYELISLIRKKCPGVLIIAHTSDAPGLNSCPTNPYKSAGVEIVDKRDWNAISGIVRRKLKKGDDSQGDVSF